MRTAIQKTTLSSARTSKKRISKKTFEESVKSLQGFLAEKKEAKEKKQVNSLRYLQKHLSKLYQDGQIQIYK